MDKDRFYIDFPSLKDQPDGPHGWVQWKGTDVCIDLHCTCGADHHFDGEFLYHFKCGECGQVYEVGGFIKLHPLQHEPEGTHLLELTDA